MTTITGIMSQLKTQLAQAGIVGMQWSTPENTEVVVLVGVAVAVTVAAGVVLMAAGNNLGHNQGGWILLAPLSLPLHVPVHPRGHLGGHRTSRVNGIAALGPSKVDGSATAGGHGRSNTKSWVRPCLCNEVRSTMWIADILIN